MKKILFFSVIFCFTIFYQAAKAQEQKLIGDCTISYLVICQNSGKVNKCIKTVFIRNSQSRTDLQTDGFLQSVIYDDLNSTAVVLRELNGEKYMSVLSADRWKKQNVNYDGLIFINTNESKTILGYPCKKLKAVLKDGSNFSIFYYPGFLLSCSENPWQFKNIPGIVLEYEMQNAGGQKITFTGISLDFNPVPLYKFEIPKSGYRVLN